MGMGMGVGMGMGMGMYVRDLVCIVAWRPCKRRVRGRSKTDVICGTGYAFRI